MKTTKTTNGERIAAIAERAEASAILAARAAASGDYAKAAAHAETIAREAQAIVRVAGETGEAPTDDDRAQAKAERVRRRSALSAGATATLAVVLAERRETEAGS